MSRLRFHSCTISTGSYRSFDLERTAPETGQDTLSAAMTRNVRLGPRQVRMTVAPCPTLLAQSTPLQAWSFFGLALITGFRHWSRIGAWSHLRSRRTEVAALCETTSRGAATHRDP